MPQPKEDYTSARRFTSFDTESVSPPPTRYDAGYECELPPDARIDLTDGSKSGQDSAYLLSRLLRPLRTKRTSLYSFALLITAGWCVIALLASLNRKPTTPATPAPDLVLQHSREALSAPPVSGWHSDGTAYGRAGVIGQPASAPRATLVKPAPKATLIGVPIPQATILFPPGRTPLWRATGKKEWTIWQPGNLDYIYIVDAQCTLSRADAIGKRVNNFAPRAEPVETTR